MAPDLVIKHLTRIRDYNVLLYRLAASSTIFSGRTLLQHIKTVNKLSINVMLTLSCWSMDRECNLVTFSEVAFSRWTGVGRLLERIQQFLGCRLLTASRRCVLLDASLSTILALLTASTAFVLRQSLDDLSKFLLNLTSLKWEGWCKFSSSSTNSIRLFLIKAGY